MSHCIFLVLSYQQCADLMRASATGHLGGHWFCKDCWSKWFEQKILKEGECSMVCQEETCNALVPREFVELNISSRAQKVLSTLILTDFVGSEKHIKHCCGRDCNQYVERLEGHVIKYVLIVNWQLMPDHFASGITCFSLACFSHITHYSFQSPTLSRHFFQSSSV